MTFDEVLVQVRDLLQREQRVSYRGLKRRFALDDEYLEDLKEELIGAKRLAADEDGRFLVWTGDQETVGAPSRLSFSQPALLPVEPRLPEAERRQLTVMFCDLVGSTPLAEKLDPEDLRQVILAYQQACAEQIQHFEGYLARYVGDGLLVYFGYPQAHEDDAQRAVRTGLGIVATLPELNTQVQQTVQGLRDSPLQVRIGIHTGLVVVGDMGGGGYRDPLAIVGETPNIAARLQGLAEPNRVVISEATARLIQGLFECHACGPQVLKGVSTPVPVYHVLREGEAQSRFEVAVSTGLTPLIGREHEVGLLQERWERAKQGTGQAVLLSGEPGIGKSRLVQTLKEQALQDKVTRIEFRCSPYHQNSAFYPLVEHLQRLLQFAPHEPSHAKLTKLQQTLATYHFPQAETFPLLASLLSLPHPEGIPPLTLSPQKQKQKTQEALVAWLVEEAERTAVYCAWEDLHWVDPSTLEVLTLYLEQILTTRIFMVLTCRPEFTPPWGACSYLMQLTLSRLERQQVEAMVAKVTGGKALPAEVLHQIVAKTDGVPLFVEELTKMVLESGLLREEDGRYVGAHTDSALQFPDTVAGRAPTPLLAIPTTLQDSLMARLDRLGTAKEVAQLGATLGREFSYELLQAVSPVDEVGLRQALAKLVEAEVLYQRSLPLQARYLFKHALIQDAAYQSLLKSTRQKYHRQIAQVLEEHFSEMKGSQPELLAHHYTEAGLVPQAIPYWQEAGQKAARRSANIEAIVHFTKGLELLKTLPDTTERIQQELLLQLALGTPLIVTKGQAAPEVERVYARALELCQQLGETPQLFPVLHGLFRFYIGRAECLIAGKLAKQLLSLAQSVQDPGLLLAAHMALEFTLLLLGEFASAREHLEQALALYDPQKHNPHISGAVGDPGVICLTYGASALWSLGYPDQAVKRSDEALTLAQGLCHPYSLAHAFNFAAALYGARREWHGTQERVEAALILCAEQGFALHWAMGTCLRGWVLAEQAQGEEGIAQICQGLSAFRAIGTEAGRTRYLAWLAKAYGKVGQPEKGFTVLADALAQVDKTGERFYEAELYRLKGELVLQSGVRGPTSESTTPQPPTPSTPMEVEGCFWRAIGIARRQQAKSLELRAAVSLSRLWQSQGKKEEARKLLADIYGWFTEGFDTKDLQEAKTLLEELT